jgi:hypothetical protein
MAANTNVNFELKVETEANSNESCEQLTPKQRLERLAHEVFEGREEYLGLTPD